LVPEESRERVAADLMSAVRRELVRPERSTSPGEDAFRFRHQLVRDATYDAIPKGERAEMHERFADWLEAVARESIAEQEEIVGYHLERAVRYRQELGPDDDATRSLARRASERLARSGRRASGRGDHAAALRLQRRALDLRSPEDRDVATLVYDTAVGEAEMARPEAAMQAFERAAALALEDGDEILEWLARIGATGQRMLVDPLATPTDDVMAELFEAIAVFERSGDDRGLATAWTYVADHRWLPCLFDQAKAAAGNAVEHAVRAGDAQLLARSVVTSLAAGGFGSERPDDSLGAIDRALEQVGPNLQIERLAAVERATSVAMLGDVRRAQAALEELSARADVDSAGFAGAAILETLATVDFWGGDLRAAEAHFKTAYQVLHARGDDAHASTEAANLARTLCWLGRFDEAEASADIAIATGAPDDLATQVPARIAKAWVSVSRGAFDDIETAIEAVHRYDGAEAPNSQGDAWLDLGCVFLAADRVSQARDAIGRAIELFERKGNVPMAAIARTQLERASR
jgi:tetratricopeptide (TPR) repeat protein